MLATGAAAASSGWPMGIPLVAFQRSTMPDQEPVIKRSVGRERKTDVGAPIGRRTCSTAPADAHVDMRQKRRPKAPFLAPRDGSSARLASRL
jgi:hypothetical protein